MPRALADIRSFARSHTRMAINTLASIARKGSSESARVTAATVLLERGWGKPQQDVALNGDIKITIRKMLEDSDEGEMIDVTPVPLEIEGK